MKKKNDKLFLGILLLTVTTVLLLPGKKLGTVITELIKKNEQSVERHIQEYKKMGAPYGAN
jgi:hypothetical protein